MAKDVLGKEIFVGDKVLWANSSGKSGFAGPDGDHLLEVIKIGNTNITVTAPWVKKYDFKLRNFKQVTTSIPPGSCIVVTDLQ